MFKIREKRQRPPPPLLECILIKLFMKDRELAIKYLIEETESHIVIRLLLGLLLLLLGLGLSGSSSTTGSGGSSGTTGGDGSELGGTLSDELFNCGGEKKGRKVGDKYKMKYKIYRTRLLLKLDSNCFLPR